MVTDNQNPLIGAPPYIDMDNPDVRAKILGLPAPSQQASAAPTIVGAPTAPKTDIANVPPTVAGTLAMKDALRPPAPSVTATPTGASKIAADQEHQLDINKFKDTHGWGSKPSAEIDPSTGLPFAGNHPGKLGKFLHGLATVGNVAGDIFAPAVTAAIPNSQLGRKAAEAQELKQGLGAEKQASEENLQSAEATKDKNTVPAGKNNSEETFADLMTGDNGKPRINPDTKQPYTKLEADAAVKQAEDTKVQDPMKQAVGDAGITQPNAQLTQIGSAIGLSGDAQKQFNDAYSVKPTDTLEEANKKIEAAKGVAQLQGAERDRKIAQDAQKQNHADAEANINATRGLESVQYKDKNGSMVSGSYNDAAAAGAEKTARKISPEDDKNNRTVYAQFSRWQDNIANAADTMKAWDNPADKDLALRVLHNVSAGIHTGILNIDSQDLQNAFLNSADYKAMTPAGQEHMQNMYQLWSDAINLMKTETGGVPRGEHFLKMESAILPQPEKTQEQNRTALKQFSTRIMDDTGGHVRPNDIDPIIPFDAQYITKGGKRIGYVTADGKRTDF